MLTEEYLLARYIYSLLFYLLIPVVVLRLLWRSIKAPAYRKRWQERFGFVRKPAAFSVADCSPVIWVHAVSVGETLAAVPMIRALQAKYPKGQLIVTTTTPTGSARVTASFGDSVFHCYAPYDLPCAVGRFLRRMAPDMVVIMETELWPNILHLSRRRGIPVVLANARLSASSARGYRRFSWLATPMLADLSCVAAQHQGDGERFVSLGLSPAVLTVTGNIKFDVVLDEAIRAKAKQLKGEWCKGERRGESQRVVWLVASTHRGEDDIILEAFSLLLASLPDDVPQPLLVLVPRHPERFNEVAQLCEQRGLTMVRRSEGIAPRPEQLVLLGDTMGELLAFFGACDMAFVGGSLVPVGGHNIIEPAMWRLPIVTGPELHNFAEVSRLLLDAGGMAVCHDAAELSRWLGEMIKDPHRRETMGRAAQQIAEQNRGALDKLLTVIEGQLSSPQCSDPATH